MLRGKTILLGLLALGAAVGSGLLAQNWLTTQRAHFEAALAARSAPEPEEAPVAEVLIAAKTLPTGAFLRESHLKWVAFPEEAVLDSYFLRETLEAEGGAAGLLEGAVARRSLAAGEPITRAKIVRPGERGFLAAVLRPGARAVSVPINATAGVSGFVFPGDAVDLLLTMTLILNGRERRVTETVLSDIRVLAVDQRTNDQEGEPALAKTATLEVDPKQAEVIAVAMEMGRLSLALRSLASEEQPDAGVALAAADLTPADLQRLRRDAAAATDPAAEGEPSYTWDDDATSFLRRRAPQAGAAPAPPPPVTVRIVRRGEAETQSFKKTVPKTASGTDG
ncbi:MAG: Flp pilus assembly protein CpaB [Alphaproteobacteria bacterium]|nr:Flp pilus assembly protein CpaB [Alphaproteobacteria bacterium]